MLIMSFGLLFLISLPLSVSAWGLGRDARRSGTSAPGVARAGEVLGIVGTLLASLRWRAAPRSCSRWLAEALAPGVGVAGMEVIPTNGRTQQPSAHT